MSGSLFAGAAIGLGVGVAVGAVATTLSSILNQSSRYLVTPVGTIVPNITIEEHHSDDLAITEHPIERGASITDHSFKHPAEVTMQLGWSNSSPFSGGTESYVRQVYASLLAAQSARQPIQVVTGKRTYDTMLIQSLNLKTDASSEYALMITAALKEIIIVDTVAATIAPQSNQALPSSTASVVNSGVKTPIATSAPVNSSGLNSIVGLFN